MTNPTEPGGSTSERPQTDESTQPIATPSVCPTPSPTTAISQTILAYSLSTKGVFSRDEQGRPVFWTTMEISFPIPTGPQSQAMFLVSPMDVDEAHRTFRLFTQSVPKETNEFVRAFDRFRQAFLSWCDQYWSDGAP
jgi:hypothetical protein